MTDAERRQAELEHRQRELLTVREFAFITRENPWTVYKRIGKGLQPGVVRCGGTIRIDMTQVLIQK